MSYLRLSRKVDSGPSGIEEREDIAKLRIGGNSVEVEDDGEGDTEVREDCLLVLFQPLVQVAILTVDKGRSSMANIISKFSKSRRLCTE